MSLLTFDRRRRPPGVRESSHAALGEAAAAAVAAALEALRVVLGRRRPVVVERGQGVVSEHLEELADL